MEHPRPTRYGRAATLRGSYDPGTGTETGRSTALLYAIAKRAQPLGRSDWTVVGDVDALDRPDPPDEALPEVPGGGRHWRSDLRARRAAGSRSRFRIAPRRRCSSTSRMDWQRTRRR